MALAASVTGDGHVTSKSKSFSFFTTETQSGSQTIQHKFKEEMREITTEWVALTYSAASAAVDAITGDNEIGRLEEDNRVVGSYKFSKTVVVKTVTWVSSTVIST